MLAIICGVCGLQFDQDDTTQVEQHKQYHEEKFTSRSTLELPDKVRDMIRYWAENILRKANDESLQEEVDIARWVMMHMWHQDDYMKNVNVDYTFEFYEKEIKKRYPNTRLVPSIYTRVRVSVLGVEKEE